MIFYSDKNVYEAALERFRYIFREFYGKRKIVVTMSGGKDSTVVLNLAHEIMKEMGIEKIPVLFLDQEAETPMTIEYIRYIMHLPWVEPYWIQSYFQEWNASKGEWFNVWGPGEKWIREKEPDSYGDLEIPHNQYFSKTLDQVHRMLFGKDYLTLGGVRIEESPARLSGLTRGECLPGITWGGGGGYYKDGTPRSLVLYPIWDWKVYDVWYYIFSNKLPYCKLYNYQFTQKPLRACRVSSLIHEQAIHDLGFIKEVDPWFYDKLVRRVANVNTSVHVFNEVATYCYNLPPYFKDWDEYVDYLADNLCEDKKNADCVLWVDKDMVVANNYNPNHVADKEMRLLYTSVREDGYTMPIVTIWDEKLQKYVIIDGFHRNLVIRKFADINERCGGKLPIVVLDKDIDQRMASTVRHNRARGSHSVDGMVNIVFNMLRDGVSEREICEKVGLEQKELVKLKYVTGFAKIFKNYKYNAAIEKVVDERRVARETAKKKEDKK